MKTVTQYKEDIKALMKKAADIDAKCVNENRDPVEAELTLKDEILDTVKHYKTIIDSMERQERMASDLEKPQERVTKPAPQDNKGHGITIRDKDRFNSFGEQIVAVINSGKPGGHTDPRLFNAASGLGESVPSDGGFLVQKDFSNNLFNNLFENGLIASKCQKIPISGNSNGTVINGFDETSRASSTSGGVIIYMADEAAEKTASKPKFRRVELNLKKMIGLCYMTDEMMADASVLEAAVSSAFSKGFESKLQDLIINGTGAGEPLGVLNAGCLVSVAKETGQTADTIVAENIIKAYSRRFASQTGNYAWYYNQDIEPQLFTMSLGVGTGGIPLYMPPGGLSDTPYARIMGLPAYAIEQCPTLGGLGDIILANFADGYLLAEKGGMRSDVSIHLRFVYDETALRFTLRVDGQPWRASALTPMNGTTSTTQSHFIAIAAR